MGNANDLLNSAFYTEINHLIERVSYLEALGIQKIVLTSDLLESLLYLRPNDVVPCRLHRPGPDSNWRHQAGEYLQSVLSDSPVTFAL